MGALKCHRFDGMAGSGYFWRAWWGSEEGKAEDFTVFIALCRLNLLSLFPPWRVEKNNRGVLKLFKSVPAIWGQQVMKAGPLKKNENNKPNPSIRGMAAVLITY